MNQNYLEIDFSPAMPRDNKWHFVSATRTGSKINTYIDGVELPRVKKIQQWKRTIHKNWLKTKP